jgi:LysR family nod box-dependent transcriptional activator
VRFNKLDLNLLVALDVLLKERSVTRAAELMHVSASAMSGSLSRLREYFDDELLVSIGRKMEITPRGALLQDGVRDLLLRIESTIGAQPEFQPHASDRTFRIFASDFVQAILAPPMFKLAAQAHSTVRFEFLAQVAQPHRDLERGEADLLIIPTGFMSPEHPLEPLFYEDFVCVVWRDSRLAAGELSFDRYVNAEHVTMQPSGSRADAFETWFLKRYGVTRKVTVTTYSFVTLPAMVVGTERIATMHRRLARQLSQAWPLEIRPTPIAIDRMEESMQWHKFRSKDSGLVWLRALLKQAAQHLDEV